MQTICIVLHWIVWRMEESRFSLSIIQKNVRLHFIEWWESFFSTTNEWKMWSKWMTKFMILKLIGSDVRCHTIIVIILTSSFEMDTQTCLSCKRAIIFTQQIELTLKIKYFLRNMNGKHGNSAYRTSESNVTVNWTSRSANNYLWSQNSAYWSEEGVQESQKNTFMKNDPFNSNQMAAQNRRYVRSVKRAKYENIMSRSKTVQKTALNPIRTEKNHSHTHTLRTLILTHFSGAL